MISSNLVLEFFNPFELTLCREIDLGIPKNRISLSFRFPAGKR